MTDVLLDLARLSDARDALAAAKEAFDDAVKINDTLETAIDRPQGMSKLQDRVGWFEANWSGNRDELAESVQNVHDRLAGIVDNWVDWEAQATAELEAMEGGS